MRIVTAIGFALVSALDLQAAQPPNPAAKGQGNFSEFEALTGTQTAAVAPKAAATNAAPGPSAPVVRNDVSFVSNVLAIAAVSSTNASPVVSLNGYAPDDKYKLRVGDRLSFQIVEDRDPPKAVLVADN